MPRHFKHLAYGARARQALSRMVFGERVRVVDKGPDKYKRTLGDVYVGEKLINLAMVEEGMAWVYRDTQDLALRATEELARKEKRGLWADKEPLPPWEFRAKKQGPA